MIQPLLISTFVSIGSLPIVQLACLRLNANVLGVFRRRRILVAVAHTHKLCHSRLSPFSLGLPSRSSTPHRPSVFRRWASANLRRRPFLSCWSTRGLIHELEHRHFHFAFRWSASRSIKVSRPLSTNANYVHLPLGNRSATRT